VWKLALRTLLVMFAMVFLLWLVVDAFTFLAIGRRTMGN
jgi:hypothetical protein